MANPFHVSLLLKLATRRLKLGYVCFPMADHQENNFRKPRLFLLERG